MSMASPFTRPSPNDRRVGIRIGTFEACSGFTRVTARRIAQLPKATFVTRLQPCRLPDKTARQLPDLSTTVWVEPSSTGDSRLRGARSKAAVSRWSITRPQNLHKRPWLAYDNFLHVSRTHPMMNCPYYNHKPDSACVSVPATHRHFRPVARSPDTENRTTSGKVCVAAATTNGRSI